MHYFRLQVVLQNYPYIVQHRFTWETSNIFLECKDLMPLEDDMCVTTWNWERREHASLYGGSPKDFDLIMAAKWFSRNTWLNYFITYYPYLPYTWKWIKFNLVKPVPKYEQSAFAIDAYEFSELVATGVDLSESDDEEWVWVQILSSSGSYTFSPKIKKNQ